MMTSKDLINEIDFGPALAMRDPWFGKQAKKTVPMRNRRKRKTTKTSLGQYFLEKEWKWNSKGLL